MMGNASEIDTDRVKGRPGGTRYEVWVQVNPYTGGGCWIEWTEEELRRLVSDSEIERMLALGKARRVKGRKEKPMSTEVQKEQTAEEAAAKANADIQAARDRAAQEAVAQYQSKQWKKYQADGTLQRTVSEALDAGKRGAPHLTPCEASQIEAMLRVYASYTWLHIDERKLAMALADKLVEIPPEVQPSLVRSLEAEIQGLKRQIEHEEVQTRRVLKEANAVCEERRVERDRARRDLEGAEAEIRRLRGVVVGQDEAGVAVQGLKRQLEGALAEVTRMRNERNQVRDDWQAMRDARDESLNDLYAANQGAERLRGLCLDYITGKHSLEKSLFNAQERVERYAKQLLDLEARYSQVQVQRDAQSLRAEEMERKLMWMPYWRVAAVAAFGTALMMLFRVYA